MHRFEGGSPLHARKHGLRLRAQLPRRLAVPPPRPRGASRPGPV